MATQDNRFSDEHFKQFASSLEGAIAYYKNADDKSFLEKQKDQVNLLINLEKKFKLALIAHSEGVGIYKKFIQYICEERRNILDARPYFRERQNIFTQHISLALRKRSERALFKFRFNFRFIQFVLSVKAWKPRSRLALLGKQISDVRSELITMNMPLAISRARIFYSRTQKSHLSYMDLIQIACEGLMSGIDKFVPPYSRAFRGVAIGRITGNFIESLHQDTILNSYGQKPKAIRYFKPGDSILCVDNEGKTVRTDVVALHDHGMVTAWRVEFDDGYTIVCSPEHKFLTSVGMVPVKEIVARDLGVLCEPSVESQWLDDSLRALDDHEGRAKVPPGSLFGLHGSETEDKTSFDSSRACEEHPIGRMGLQMRVDVSKTLPALPPSSRLSNVQGSGGLVEEGEYHQVENGQLGKVHGVGYARSSEGAGSSEVLQDGGVATGERGNDVGRRAHQLQDFSRGGTEASRFRQPRPQDLGGSRRFLPFLSSDKGGAQVPVGEDPGQGRHAESGSYSALRSDVYQALDGVLLFAERKDASRVASHLYSDAPLASTGSLVFRKVVRVRPVGECRMYDLEVAHPKHNFLLPNGIVTSNSYSETLIHFYPLDKRKIYRANKYASRNAGALDFESVAAHVNNGVEQPHRTTDSEISSLMAAASTVSSDAVLVTDEEDDKGRVADRFAAPVSCQPDVQVEQHDAMRRMAGAMSVLTVFDKKILRGRGVDANSLY